MNKQQKILENRKKQLQNELNELNSRLNDRMQYLARNDPMYQNMLGQKLEKDNRLKDLEQFLELIEKGVDNPDTKK